MMDQAVITCPYCKVSKEELMPARYRVDSYLCTACGKMLTPESGECCVFCAFSNTICPPQQEKRNCCSD